LCMHSRSFGLDQGQTDQYILKLNIFMIKTIDCHLIFSLINCGFFKSFAT
jgi:hypothetical protein